MNSNIQREKKIRNMMQKKLSPAKTATPYGMENIEMIHSEDRLERIQDSLEALPKYQGSIASITSKPRKRKPNDETQRVNQ